MPPPWRPLEDRFLDKVEPEPNSGCWLWVGCVSSRGYGKIKADRLVDGRKDVNAHRVAWSLYRGPLSPGLVIDHLCRVSLCVNPAHLDLVSEGENIRRGISPNIILHREQRCAQGHPFSMGMRGANGKQRCRPCNNARARRSRLMAKYATA